MDEPLSNLDAILRERMRIELRRFHDRLGITTIYVTHDQKEAISMSDRVMVMNAGRIEQIGSPEDIIRHPLTEFAARFMGQPPMNIWRASLEINASGAARVTDGLGPAWTVPGLWPSAPGGPADVWLGVRPRDLELAGLGEAADLTVTLDVVERGGGDEVFLHCRHRDDTLVVSVNGGSSLPRTGELVGLTLRSDRVHLFDAGTGARIQPSPANGRSAAASLVAGELQ
ncbi:sugar ABC transporter ATP-binding protein [mine drainage metagenome]|uniref:Sugar ABC transporter ATP-binding protein n=1 Tax=mine drainage metagenome TaxID=410659 RepID=T1BH22_9ZZZZ